MSVMAHNIVTVILQVVINVEPKYSKAFVLLTHFVMQLAGCKRVVHEN